MAEGITTTLEFDKGDLQKLFSMIERTQKELGTSSRGAIKQAGYYVMGALSRSTKVSRKLRPIVKNPHPDATRDGRRAKYGVERYDRDGNKIFVPIFRTGEYGKIRFQNKKTAEWLVRDKITGEVTRETASTGTGEFDMAGIAQSKRRIISRRGLAQKSWQWAKMHLTHGGSGQVKDVPNLVNVSWIGGDNLIGLKIVNHTRYMDRALKNGRESVTTAMARAANSMEKAIDKKIAKSIAKGA